MSVPLCGTVRALVVEQLNPEQWHVIQKGQAVPDGSLEGMPGGVSAFGHALNDALDRSILTGLPVLVEPLGRRPRYLTAREARHRVSRSAAFYQTSPDDRGRAA